MSTSSLSMMQRSGRFLIFNTFRWYLNIVTAISMESHWLKGAMGVSKTKQQNTVCVMFSRKHFSGSGVACWKEEFSEHKAHIGSTWGRDYLQADQQTGTWRKVCAARFTGSALPVSAVHHSVVLMAIKSHNNHRALAVLLVVVAFAASKKPATSNGAKGRVLTTMHVYAWRTKDPAVKANERHWHQPVAGKSVGSTSRW